MGCHFLLYLNCNPWLSQGSSQALTNVHLATLEAESQGTLAFGITVGLPLYPKTTKSSFKDEVGKTLGQYAHPVPIWFCGKASNFRGSQMQMLR